MEISNRLKAIPPYVFAELDKKRAVVAARGVDVINLGIGDPDQATPAHVVKAMKDALDNPLNHRYPPFGGTKEYKEAAAAWCNRRFGIEINPENEITSLIGSKEGIHNIIAAFVDPGDISLIPDPAYPVYKTSTILAGGTPHTMPLLAKNGFRADLSTIPEDVARKAKIMFLNYPNNPTAGVCDLAYLEEAVAFARKYDILFVHDLAYSEMVYDGYVAHSVFEVKGAKDVAIELHSLSKAHNMTGWRIGFAIGNAYAIKGLAQLKSNIDTDVFRAVQAAAIAAFNGPTDDIERCNALYKERRDVAVAGFRKLGWTVDPIKATFYMWLPVPSGMSSAEFSTLMLEEAGIVVPPGTAYGACGEGYFRLSLCTSKERLQEAFERMEKHSIRFDRNTSKV
ncbi:MAG: LL-diaminopimelate aminotransferase [Candidatus Obscuribacterales bacterium]|nr:LL-diaminopimelate aminotransferase [Candidatus Obscuribacterales bacterium]